MKRDFVVTMLAVVQAESENRAAELGWDAAKAIKGSMVGVADVVVKRVD